MDTSYNANVMGDKPVQNYSPTIERMTDNRLGLHKQGSVTTNAEQYSIFSPIPKPKNNRDLPLVVIVNLFIVLQCDYFDWENLMVYDPYHDGLTTSVCLALTCFKYWEVFAGLWCELGTTRIRYVLNQHQSSILQLALRYWIPASFRNASYHNNSRRVPMFLSRRIYGHGIYPSYAERRLVGRHHDRYSIRRLDNLVDPRTPIFIASPNLVDLPSPQGLGEAWYQMAAALYRDHVWKFYGRCLENDRNNVIPSLIHVWFSWVDFRGTEIYKWLYDWSTIEPLQIDERVRFQMSQRLKVGVESLSYSEKEVKTDLRQFDRIMNEEQLETTIYYCL